MLRILKILNYPIMRHFIAGGAIVILLWFFSIAPLQESNRELRESLNEVTDNQHKLIEKLFNKDTYKIQNQLLGAKVKKGGNINMFPDNKLSLDPKDRKRVEQTAEKKGKYRKHWWQIWRKKQNNK